jgi:nicotinate-nucleotide--dimethylbenzimidazole phosphoribosyltransferase
LDASPNPEHPPGLDPTTAIPGPDEAARQAAAVRQAALTKPPGALGRLEEAAIELAALQGRSAPALDRVTVAVFAGDHGVAHEGVSAFPQSVTGEMVRNFARGGAAINALARHLAADLEVIDVGTAVDPGALAGVRSARAGAGTANFCTGPAMTPAQRTMALAAGRAAADRAAANGAQAFIGGDMGIANTTAATALACALLERDPRALAGAGTGLDTAGVAHKVAVIERALARQPAAQAPLDLLGEYGGFEMAALTGAFIASARQGVPVLVDGFIAAVAALVGVRVVPSLAPWLVATHRSAEAGHEHVLAALGLAPLLDLDMRLGEGSGAAVAVPVLRSACALHADMATFAEAGVASG